MDNQLKSCPFCGEEILSAAKKCKHCKEFLDVSSEQYSHTKVQPKSILDDPAIRFLLPVGRSGFSIAAGYTGLFSLASIDIESSGLIMLVPATLSTILGLLGIIDIKRHPHKHGLGRSIFGLIMGIIFIVIGIYLYWTK